jgi:hypothetical protein
VIIILLGDLPSKDLDPDIRLYLKNHTYLNCEDKKFWDKLRYALPDVKVKAPLFRGAVGRTSGAPHGNSTLHRSSAPPPPPPHYQYPNHLQSSPNLTSNHHQLNLNSMNFVANNTPSHHNMTNTLNSMIYSNSGGGNGSNNGTMMMSVPNIVPLVTTSGSQRSNNQQRQYHSIVNSSLSANNPNRHTAVHI